MIVTGVSKGGEVMWVGAWKGEFVEVGGATGGSMAIGAA